MGKAVGQAREILLVMAHLQLLALHAKRAVEAAHPVMSVANLERITRHGYGALAVVAIHVHRHAVPAIGKGSVEYYYVVILEFAVTWQTAHFERQPSRGVVHIEDASAELELVDYHPPAPRLDGRGHRACRGAECIEHHYQKQHICNRQN